MLSCEDETLSTPTECRLVRPPLRPDASGMCPPTHEKIQGKPFLLPTCLPIVPPIYFCDAQDPRLCVRPRMVSTYPPLDLAYPS